MKMGSQRNLHYKPLAVDAWRKPSYLQIIESGVCAHILQFALLNNRDPNNDIRCPSMLFNTVVILSKRRDLVPITDESFVNVARSIITYGDAFPLMTLVARVDAHDDDALGVVLIRANAACVLRAVAALLPTCARYADKHASRTARLMTKFVTAANDDEPLEAARFLVRQSVAEGDTEMLKVLRWYSFDAELTKVDSVTNEVVRVSVDACNTGKVLDTLLHDHTRCMPGDLVNATRHAIKCCDQERISHVAWKFYRDDAKLRQVLDFFVGADIPQQHSIGVRVFISRMCREHTNWLDYHRRSCDALNVYAVFRATMDAYEPVFGECCKELRK